MRYYIADPHFFHEGLNTKMDRRGFADAEEMNACNGQYRLTKKGESKSIHALRACS